MLYFILKNLLNLLKIKIVKLVLASFLKRNFKTIIFYLKNKMITTCADKRLQLLKYEQLHF